MAKQDPEAVEPTEERSEERLAEALEEANRREESHWTPIWKGMLFGIGSTVGLALALYLLALVFQTASGLPVIGSFLDATIGPSIEQTLETRGLAPSVSPSASTTSTPTPSSTSAITGSSKVSTNYFSITMPAGWDVKLNQSSNAGEESRLVAESDDYSETDGAQLTVVVYETSVFAEGDHPCSSSSESIEITVDQVAGTFYRFTDSNDSATENRVACFERNDLIYILELTYRPAAYTIAGTVFDDILASFQFKD